MILHTTENQIDNPLRKAGKKNAIVMAAKFGFIVLRSLAHRMETSGALSDSTILLS